MSDGTQDDGLEVRVHEAPSCWAGLQDADVSVLVDADESRFALGLYRAQPLVIIGFGGFGSVVGLAAFGGPSEAFMAILAIFGFTAIAHVRQSSNSKPAELQGERRGKRPP